MSYLKSCSLCYCGDVTIISGKLMIFRWKMFAFFSFVDLLVYLFRLCILAIQKPFHLMSECVSNFVINYRFHWNSLNCIWFWLSCRLLFSFRSRLFFFLSILLAWFYKAAVCCRYFCYFDCSNCRFVFTISYIVFCMMEQLRFKITLIQREELKCFCLISFFSFSMSFLLVWIPKWISTVVSNARQQSRYRQRMTEKEIPFVCAIWFCSICVSISITFHSATQFPKFRNHKNSLYNALSSNVCSVFCTNFIHWNSLHTIITLPQHMSKFNSIAHLFICVFTSSSSSSSSSSLLSAVHFILNQILIMQILRCLPLLTAIRHHSNQK